MAENGEGKTGVSYIEVDKPVSDKDLVEVQEKCNEVIREALTVTVTTYNVGDPELEEAHTRGLPSDHSGPVRMVTIPGIDTNLCCGTHVSNTSQLQMVHLMGIESKVRSSFISIAKLTIGISLEKQTLSLLPRGWQSFCISTVLCFQRESSHKTFEQCS